MGNDGYNHNNSKGCEKDWIKNAEYLRDKKARFVFVGKSSCGFIHGHSYCIYSRIRDDRLIWIYDKNSRAQCPYQSLESFLANWKPIEEDIYIKIDRVIEETQKSIIEFMSRYGIEPNTILMSEDKLKIVTDYVTSPTSEIVRLMGYPVKLIAGREIIKAALL